MLYRDPVVSRISAFLVASYFAWTVIFFFADLYNMGVFGGVTGKEVTRFNVIGALKTCF